MSPSRSTFTVRPLATAVCKELRRMSRNLVRYLDTMSHVTVVVLALYVGVATFGVGVV